MVSNKTMRNHRLLDRDYLSGITAFRCLWESCEKHLNEVAITYKADVNVLDKNKQVPRTMITYGDLIKNIIRTYNALKELGVKEGDVITFSSTSTTPELIYTAYASMLCGAIFDPIDPRIKEEALLEHFKSEPSKLYFVVEPMFEVTRNVYGDINAQNIITLSLKESLPPMVKLGSKILDIKNGVKPFRAPDDKRFLTWDEFIKGAKTKVDKIPKFKRDTIISYAHTTGTTGKSKTLVHTNENWNAQWNNIYSSDLEVVRGETLFNVAVPWVDFGLVLGIHVNLCDGVRMDLDPTWLPEKNVDYLLKNRPDWWLGAPGWLDPLFTDEKYKDADLRFGRYFMTGGAPLFPHKHELYRQILKEKGSPCQVMPGYGLSEVTAPAFLNENDAPGILGRPFPLIDYKIVDPTTSEELEQGQSGELWLRSKHEKLTPLALGYLNAPEGTEKTFVYSDGHRWVRTGDRVHENPNGSVTWESRYKNILTFNGYNIDLDKLLELVESVPGVGKGAIIGAVTADGNQRPVICIELAPLLKMSDFNSVKDSIFAMVAKVLPEYYEPLDVVLYDALPLKSMKINYNQLKDDNLNVNGEYVKSFGLKRGIKES